MTYHYFGASSKEIIPRGALGKTGLQVGRLGLGTWELGDQNIPVSDTQKIIKAMLDRGGNLIDTSDNYDGAEAILGQAIKAFNRDDLVVVTKCGDYTDRTFDPKTGLSTNHPDFKYADLNFTPKVIRRNVEDSLKKLGVDHLDVLLIHTAFLDKMRQGDVVDATIQAQREGKVRFIGYSGDNAEALYSLLIPEFSVLEYSLNIADVRNAEIIVDEAKKRGFGTIIKRPIANAFWRKDLYMTALVYGDDYRKRALHMGIKPSHFGLPNNNAGWVELAIAFTLSHPVDCLAIGTTRLDHMQQNIELVSRLAQEPKLVKKVKDIFHRAENNIPSYAAGKPWLGLE